MKNRHLLILNIVLFISVLGIMNYKGFTDHYYVNDDVRVLFYINNFQENIENNILAQYANGKWLAASIYLSNFYALINIFIDFIFFTKLMSVIAFSLSVVFIYKLGKIIKDERYALLLTFLFILQPWTIQPFSGGLSKSFVFPLLIAFLYYFIKKDIRKLSLVLILEAMLHPITLLISLLTFGLSLVDLKEKRINFDLNKNYLLYIFAIISFLLVLVPLSFVNYGIKEQVTLKDAIFYPEFYDGGKLPIFRGIIPFTSDAKSIISSLISIYDFRISRPLHTNKLFVLLSLTLIFMLMYRKQIFKLPRGIYLLLISSLILQSLAFILFSKLYLPVRYVQYSLPIFLIIILAHGIYFLSIREKLKPIFIILILIFLAFFVPKIDARLMHCADKGVYSYMKTLPKETLIAGHPLDMGCIALYGQKKPFIMSELNTAFYKDYYQIIRQRNFDFFSAYYSDSKLEIQNFCRDNGITHLIVNKDHFDEGFLNKSRIFYEPFNTHIKNITQNRKDFYLQNPDNVLFESGNKMVISCGS